MLRQLFVSMMCLGLVTLLSPDPCAAQSPFSTKRSSLILSSPGSGGSPAWIGMTSSSSTTENYRLIYPTSTPVIGQFHEISATSGANDTLIWQSPSGIDGNGADATVAFWDSPSTLSTSSELRYDYTNHYLGISPSAPSSLIHSTVAAAGGSLSSLSSSNICFFGENTTNSGSSGFQFAALNSVGAVREANIGINPTYLNQSGDCVLAAHGTSDGAFFFDITNGNGVVGGTYGAFNVINKLAANGNMSIGSSYRETGAPSQGLIVSGIVGIGRSTSLSQQLTVYNGTSTGTYTTSGWQHSSDRTLKTSIQPLQSSLEVVRLLSGVSFLWNNAPKAHRQIGFIAQDVERVLPEIVCTDSDSAHTKSLALANLSAVHNEAIKELLARIETIEKLKGRTSSGSISTLATDRASHQKYSLPSESALRKDTLKTVYREKQVDERCHSAQLQADDDLGITIPAHERWLIEVVVDLRGQASNAKMLVHTQTKSNSIVSWKVNSAQGFRRGVTRSDQDLPIIAVEDGNTRVALSVLVEAASLDNEIRLKWATADFREQSTTQDLIVAQHSYLKATRLP